MPWLFPEIPDFPVLSSPWLISDFLKQNSMAFVKKSILPVMNIKLTSQFQKSPRNLSGCYNLQVPILKINIFQSKDLFINTINPFTPLILVDKMWYCAHTKVILIMKGNTKYEKNSRLLFYFIICYCTCEEFLCFLTFPIYMTITYCKFNYFSCLDCGPFELNRKIW